MLPLSLCLFPPELLSLKDPSDQQQSSYLDSWEGCLLKHCVLCKAAGVCNHALHSVLMRLISVFCVCFCLFVCLCKQFNSAAKKRQACLLILNCQPPACFLICLKKTTHLSHLSCLEFGFLCSFVAKGCCMNQPLNNFYISHAPY